MEWSRRKRKVEPFLLETSLSRWVCCWGTATMTPPIENGAHPLEISMPQGTAQQDPLRANKTPQKARSFLKKFRTTPITKRWSESSSGISRWTLRKPSRIGVEICRKGYGFRLNNRKSPRCFWLDLATNRRSGVITMLVFPWRIVLDGRSGGGADGVKNPRFLNHHRLWVLKRCWSEKC